MYPRVRRLVMTKKVIPITDGSGKSGGFVPQNGVYEVSHPAHRLPEEVTLLAGEVFPRCQACEEPVSFRLRRRSEDAGQPSRFRVYLYQLPVLDRYGRAS